MKISPRETILGMLTLTVILFGFTYWMAGSKISEQKEMAADKTRLRRQIQLHKRILEERKNWIGRLDALKSQLPVNDRKFSATAALPKEIKRMADKYGLNLPLTQPQGEQKVGSLHELSVRCDWQGKLDALIHFLYDLHVQGIRFDVRQITVKPVAKQEGQLKGSMIINCAYRRADEEKR